MANTYTLIEAKTLTATTASITFTSIPQIYTNLLLKLSSRNNDTTGGNWGNYKITLGGITSSVYSEKTVYGTGSGAGASFSNSAQAFNSSVYDVRDLATANTFSNSEIYFPNYTSSNNKSFSADSITETNATSAIAILSAGLMANTSVIDQIRVEPAVGSFVQYSTFYLYGIKNS